MQFALTRPSNCQKTSAHHNICDGHMHHMTNLLAGSQESPFPAFQKTRHRISHFVLYDWGAHPRPWDGRPLTSRVIDCGRFEAGAHLALGLGGGGHCGGGLLLQHHLPCAQLLLRHLPLHCAHGTDAFDNLVLSVFWILNPRPLKHEMDSLLKL